jgi:hypothetical protein
VLDERGQKALAKELEATLARVDRIHEQARKRLGGDHATERRKTLVLLAYDDAPAPTEAKPKPKRGGTGR